MALAYMLDLPAADDPYPVYKSLRDEDPAHWAEAVGLWVLTRYEDCLAAFSDWRVWSSEQRGNLINDIPDRIGKTLGTTDPPRHDVARRLVAKAFTPTTVADLEPTMRELAGRLAADAASAGTIDFVQEVSVPYNGAVLGAMFGLAAEEFAALRRFLDDFFQRDEPGAEFEPRQVVAMRELRSYLGELAAVRRARPGADVMSAMLAARDDGVALSEEQVVVTTMTFLTAGFESVNNLLTNMVAALSTHGDTRTQLQADPAAVPAAVEEVMRWDAPAQGFVRSPSADVTVHGRRIPAGAQVLVHIGAANRDERRFPDPDRFDLGRDRTQRHLGLGHGVHFCIGAPLGRQMARLLFEALLARADKWEVDTAGGARVTTPNFRGFSALPMTV